MMALYNEQLPLQIKKVLCSVVRGVLLSIQQF
jgi:hypothetical protein